MSALYHTSPMVPLMTPRLSELWLRRPHTPSSRTGKAAAMRPVLVHKNPYPWGSCLGHAVIAQAAKDAEPEAMRGGKPKHFSLAVRERQFRALIWLTSDDPDLLYWAGLADYPVHALHHKYGPMLARVIEEHPALAVRFVLTVPACARKT